uniref:Aspartate transaminase n=1 Tax=Timema bartmani TaxID=61472 RepID=A0A7R9ETZ2_9NEOP|nr:unnamed protein product [Timema bartmani]
MEIQYLREEFRDDESEVKVDLICGVYRTEENEPWVLPVVRRVEKEMADDVTLDHEYLWFLGLDEFSQAATKLILGPQSSLLHQDRCSRPGSNPDLPVFGSLVKHKSSASDHAATEAVCVAMHHGSTRSVGMAAPIKHILLCIFGEHVVSIQTLSGTGAVRMGAELLARTLGYDTVYISVQSWDERVGALTLVLNDSLDVETVRTRLQVIVRGTYCSPPAHGAVIALRILSDPANFQEW